MAENNQKTNKINLPKTNFSMKANLSQKEPQIQKEWEITKIYNKILEKNKNNKKYILHDGPPYANGEIHLGHALNKILKDIIIKYKAMQGYFTPFIPGWDCHGLPIEYQLLKEMQTDKNHVDQLDFRKKAASFAKKFIKIQKNGFIRLGIFADWDNPYLTLLPEYEKNIISSFRKLVNDGYIYRGLKPVYWCTKCETALAEAEIEYKDISSPSIFVKFPINNDFFGENDIKIIIWTTTPWTLPSNVAIAINPNFKYVIIQIEKSLNKNILENEKFIIAEELIKKVCKTLEISSYKILKSFLGKELENIKCQSPYRKDSSIGILAKYVTIEDGTGIVHIAPGHGMDDYIVNKKYNLPIISPIDEKGNFTCEVEIKEFIGKNIFDMNNEIIKDLDDKKLLLKMQEISHNYPHCWRCKKSVIFRATKQWFLDMNHKNLKEKLQKLIENVNWIPKYGFNRISSMIENRPDWCLSRQRLWGTPIPAFYCKDCNELLLNNESIKAVENLFKEKESDVWFYKEANEILPENITCKKCGSKNFIKETDIFDVWFDSGVSSQAVLKENNELSFPADLYLEGSDQHRGWFQASLILASAIDEKAPFKNVLTHGFTVDVDGKKMSKSQKNGILPSEIFNKFGADILRLWISSINYQEDMKVSIDIINQMVDAYRKIRNTAKYILGNLNEFVYETDKINYENMLEIDKWILAEFAILSKKIINHYENNNFYLVYQDFYNFCNVKLSSIYFDIIKDRLYVMPQKSKERLSAQTVLYYLADFLTRIIAPIIPFTAEEIWKNFINKLDKKESIFLENFILIQENEKNLISTWDPDNENNKNFLKKWNEIFEFRKILLKKIEEKRLKKLIGNSLEARIIINIQKEDETLNIFNNENSKNFWKQIVIVSQVEININQNLEKYDFFKNENKISVNIEKAKGEKCDRCWNWDENIIKLENQKICQRCKIFIEN